MRDIRVFAGTSLTSWFHTLKQENSDVWDESLHVTPPPSPTQQHRSRPQHVNLQQASGHVMASRHIHAVKCLLCTNTQTYNLWVKSSRRCRFLGNVRTVMVSIATMSPTVSQSCLNLWSVPEGSHGTYGTKRAALQVKAAQTTRQEVCR